MKIKKILLKNFILQNISSIFCFLYVILVNVTSKIVHKNQSTPDYYLKNNKPFILAFWHSQLLMISYSWFSKKKLNILASGHSDGQFGATIAKLLGANTVTISDKKKKINIRPIFQLLKDKNCIGITPDGPRGPKEKVSEGIIKIAKISKVPIIPVGFGSSKNFCLKSWDSFLITLPFSKCRIVWGDSITIPENLEDQEIATYKKIIEEKINECVKKAKENLYDKSL